MKDNPYSNKAAARVWQEGYMEACRDMEHWRKVRYGKKKEFLGDDIPMNMEIVFKIQVDNKPRLFVGFRSRNRLYYYNGFFTIHEVGNIHWRYLFFPTQFRGKEGYYEGLDAAGKEVGLNKNYDGNDYLRGDAPDYEGEKPESGVANKRVKSTTTMTEIIEKIKQWVLDRNLQTGDPHIQMCKVMEELGELAKAINKKDRDQQIDGLGDVIVTLVCVAEQLGLNIEECCLAAYDEIKDRKGKMIDGVFVKEADLAKMQENGGE